MKVRKSHPKVWESSGVPGPTHPELWWSRRGREAHPEIRIGVGRPTRRPGRVQEFHLKVRVAHTKVREVSRGPLGDQGSTSGGPGGVGRPTQRFRRSHEDHPKV